MTEIRTDFAAGLSEVERGARAMPPHTYVVCASDETKDLIFLKGLGTKLHFMETVSHLLKARISSGCVLVDLDGADDCVTEVERMLTTSSLSWPLVVATGEGSIQEAVKWIKRGAIDFVEKPYCREALAASLARAWAYAEPKNNSSPCLLRLTIRQRQVLNFIGKGLFNHQIAREMGLSVRTVEMHRARLLKAMGVHTTAEAVRMANTFVRPA